MYFDFYDDRPDYLSLNRDVARLEDLLHLIVAVSAAFFLDIVALIVLVAIASMPASDDAKRAALAQSKQVEPTRFVFMAPRVDTPSLKARPDADPSDKNRTAAAPERSPNPTNPLPFSRGNSYDRVEEPSTPPPTRQRAEAQPQPPGQNGQNGQNAQNPLPLPGPALAFDRSGTAGASGAPGPLAAAVANPFRYAQGEAFNNPDGDGGQPQPSIQFDSKDVEFGPWLRRFIAQLKRNWLIPMAAMTMKGHVVVTFYVHKDGTITEVEVPGPCPVAAFNRAAQGALLTSNPTQPLPPEYPADRCFFTVTFFYNEAPPNR
jgi:TonB family protein